MPDLTHDYTMIRRHIGRYLGLKPNPTKWNDHQAELIDDIIRRGLNQYYNPPAIPPFTTTSYEWSFLKPVWKLDTVANQREYMLPPNFEYFTGPLTHRSVSGDSWPAIQITSAQKLREMQAGHNYTAWPQWAAVAPAETTGVDKQEWVLVLHPTPGEVYKIEGQYVAGQQMLDEENPYPLGGPTHAEGVLASCLAIAEEQLEGGSGSNRAEFEKRLQANIFMDIKRGPKHLGHVRNGPSAIVQSRGQARRLGLINYGDLDYEAS